MNLTLEYMKEKYLLSYDDKMPIILKISRHSGIKILFKELGFKIGVEIGTFAGRYAKDLLIAIPRLKLYCVDPWTVYSEIPEMDQLAMDRCFDLAKRRLSGFNCEIIREESMSAVKRFAPGSVDFVFVDGNHEFGHVSDDIEEWYKIVRPGGIIFGHDYSIHHEGVIRAADGYAERNKISPWFVMHAGGSIVNCWMFVK